MSFIVESIQLIRERNCIFVTVETNVADEIDKIIQSLVKRFWEDSISTLDIVQCVVETSRKLLFHFT